MMHAVDVPSPGSVPPSAAEPGEAAMRALATTMPWLISVLFHASLAVIAMFVAILVAAPPRQGPAERGAAVGLTPEPPRLRETERRRPALRPADKTITHPVPTLMKGIAQTESPGLPRPGWRDTRMASVIGRSGEPAGAGPLAPTGPRNAYDQSPPTAKFIKSRVRADLVVYVFDKSGSMFEQGSFDLLKAKLIQSLGSLRYDHWYWQGGIKHQVNQRFHILFFGPRKPVEFWPRELVPAARENVELAAEFVQSDDVRAEGGTLVLPALARAFEALREADPNGAQRKVIFLLSDGGFDGVGGKGDAYKGLRGNEAVLQWLADHNPRRGDGHDVAVCTFLYRRDDPDARRAMGEIARRHGGVFEITSADE
jgi:hypothetical protein